MNKRSKEEKRTINNNEPRDRQSDRQTDRQREIEK